MTGRRLVLDGLDTDAIKFVVAYCYGEFSTVSIVQTLFPVVAAAYHLQVRCSLALLHVWLLCYTGAHSLSWDSCLCVCVKACTVALPALIGSLR